MFINKFPPNIFVNGESLSPSDINENNKYFLKCFQQEADKQTAKWTSQYIVVPNVGTPLVGPATITRKIPTSSFRVMNRFPTYTIESYSVLAFYQSTSPITITLPNSDTIVLPARTAALATKPYEFVKLANIAAVTGDLFDITVPAGATFTKLDIQVGFSSDKYDCGDYTATLTPKPELNLVPAASGFPVNFPNDIPEFNEVSYAQSAQFTAMQTNMQNAAVDAKTAYPGRWTVAEFYGPITTGTDLFSTLKPYPCFSDPTFSGVTSAARIIGAYIYLEYTGAAFGVVKFGLTDASGNFLIPGILSTNILINGTGSTTAGVKASTTPPSGLNTVRPTGGVITSDKMIGLDFDFGVGTIDYAAVYLLLQ